MAKGKCNGTGKGNPDMLKGKGKGMMVMVGVEPKKGSKKK